MQSRIAVLTTAALLGCASAPIVAVGGNEYEIGGSSRDALHRDHTNWERHMARAQAFCADRGRSYRTIERAPPDDKFRFACGEYATQIELAVARTAWQDCMARAEPPIDDMLSDAGTVAQVLATRCNPEFLQLLDISQKGHPNPAPASAFQSDRQRVALDVVLSVRAIRRDPKSPPPPVTIPSFVRGVP